MASLIFSPDDMIIGLGGAAAAAVGAKQVLAKQKGNEAVSGIRNGRQPRRGGGREGGPVGRRRPGASAAAEPARKAAAKREAMKKEKQSDVG